jgi:hypothetical protein
MSVEGVITGRVLGLRVWQEEGFVEDKSSVRPIGEEKRRINCL